MLTPAKLSKYVSISSLYSFPSYRMIPRGASGKESAGTGDTGVTVLIPGLERSPGVENGNSLQYSSLENSTGREAWRATVLGQKDPLE